MQPAKDMSETEIYQAATQDWLRVLARLWTAVGKTPEPARLKVYQDELGDIPIGVLEKAVSRCMRQHQYSNVPTIGDLWAAINTELGAGPFAPVEDAVADWEQRRWHEIAVRLEEQVTI